MACIKKKIVSIVSLIFILCFTSFTTILILGRGAKNENIELVIFELLTYDFNLQGACVLSLIQMFFCLGIVILSNFFTTEGPLSSCTKITNYHYIEYNKNFSLINHMLIFFLLIFLLLPLFAVIFDGINKEIFNILFRADFWKALLTSIRISIISAIFSIILSMMLLWTIRELKFRQYLKTYKIFENSSIIILTIPTKIVTMGLFLFFDRTVNFLQAIENIIILINAIITMPYIIKIIENTFFDIYRRYNNLCFSLKITGFNRIKLIELNLLRNLLTQSFALSCAMSIGDLGIVSLFSDQNFFSLPLYLYQQINAYNNEISSVVGLLLLIVCCILFFIIEKLSSLKKYAKYK